MVNKMAMRGIWWRYNKYRIQDGIIMPVKSSGLVRYDVGQMYDAGEAPFDSLLELQRDLELASFQDARDELVTRWCAANGLLGIFHYRALSITLQPVWERSDRHPDYALARSQLVYIKTGGGWQKCRRQLVGVGRMGSSLPPLAPGESRDRNLEGTVAELAREEMEYAGRCVMRGIKPTLAPFREESLGLVQERYFPCANIVSRFAMPDPLSPEFWAYYGEPLDEFLSSVQWFSQMMKSTSSKRAIALNVYLGDVGAIYGESTSIRWRATSLLGHYAYMVATNLSGRFKIKQCESCARAFQTASYQAKYCDEKCQMRQQQRNYRQKKRMMESK